MTQRTLLDWLRVEYAIEKPSNKRLAPTDLDSKCNKDRERGQPEVGSAQSGWFSFAR